jgi:hypothetical protein
VQIWAKDALLQRGSQENFLANSRVFDRGAVLDQLGDVDVDLVGDVREICRLICAFELSQVRELGPPVLAGRLFEQAETTGKF